MNLLLSSSKTCSLCQMEMSGFELERHLCIEQECVVCPLCPCTNKFKSSISFLDHVSQHIEATQSTDKNLCYKCEQCNVGYSVEFLLECHKKSHKNDMTQTKELNEYDMSKDRIEKEPAQLDDSSEYELISIDDTASNDSSNLSVYSIFSIETDDVEWSGDRSTPVPENSSLDETKFDKVLDEILPSSATEIADVVIESCDTHTIQLPEPPIQTKVEPTELMIKDEDMVKKEITIDEITIVDTNTIMPFDRPTSVSKPSKPLQGNSECKILRY